MKRLVSALLAAVMVLGACGDDGGANVATLPTTTTTAAVTTTAGGTTSVATTAVSSTTVADDGIFLIEVSGSDGLTLLVEGEPVALGERIAVPRGATVRIAVVLDAADEVHVHGYDVSVDVVPGVTATLEFVADIPGIFEVELEEAHSLLVELAVS